MSESENGAKRALVSGESSHAPADYQAARGRVADYLPENLSPKQIERRDRLFRGALVRTVFGTLIAGLGLIGTKFTWLGACILGLAVLATAGGVALAVTKPLDLLASLVNVPTLVIIGLVLAVIGLAWVVLCAGTYLVSRPRGLSRIQRIVGAIVVALTSTLVITPMAIASGYAFETARITAKLFGSETDLPSQTRPTIAKGDPWKDIPRVNILMLGGDSGQGRPEEVGVRTDTIMFASIDTKTGNTVLVQIPRNLQRPIFPDDSPLASVFPWGFDDGDLAMISSVWNYVPDAYPDLFEDTAFPNADALKWAIEGTTGQKMDYFVLVNIDGLIQLVDAMDGVRVNVNYPIAKGGSTESGCGEAGWILEGPDQKLNGTDAMWFARSRCNSPGSDFGRMQRQSCLVNAIIKQANPVNMATRYEQIAKAASSMVETDIPQEHVDAIIELASRVKNGRITRLAFVDGFNGFSSQFPDFELMRQQVDEAIAQSSGNAETSETPASAPTETADSGTQSAPQTEETTQPADPGEPSEAESQTHEPGTVQEASDACAYHHEEPAWVDPTVPRYTPEPSTER